MNNPIFQSYQSRMLYAGVWMLIISIQAFVLSIFSEQSLGYLVADSFVFNTLLACFMIPLWYPVRFCYIEDKQWYYILAAYLIQACILLAVWQATGTVLMKLIAQGDPAYLNFLNRCTPWRLIEGSLLYALVILVYYLYVYVEKLNEKANNEIRLNTMIRDTELNLLKSQINPHFLFNSLNSVNSLIISLPQQAQEMLVALSDYLRYSVLSVNRIYSSLQEEMKNIDRYLSIEKLRFGNKLIYEPEIEENCLPLEIPAMLLQPLIENAIKHGVYESLQTVRIHIKIEKNEEYLSICISNDYDSTNNIWRKGSGTGLKNIRERLRLSYGAKAILQTKKEEGKFIADLRLPLENDSLSL